MKSSGRNAGLGKLLAAFITCVIIAASSASEPDSEDIARAQATDVEWFRDAKFGMFLHWGMSSELGGIWDGQKYYGITEWLMLSSRVYTAAEQPVHSDLNKSRQNK